MSEDRTSIAGKISLVTGAASGIGRSVAPLLASRGAHVIALDLNEAGLNSVVEKIKSNEGKATCKLFDLGSEERICVVIKEIENEFGHIDSVINAGGITVPTGVVTEEISWDAFHKTLSVNLFGAIWLTQAVLPLLRNISTDVLCKLHP